MTSTDRVFPMSKPDGHSPAVRRYSSVTAAGVHSVRVLVVGLQSRSGAAADEGDFRRTTGEHFCADDGPANADFAAFSDPEGYANMFAVAYWDDVEAHERWQGSYLPWWNGLDAAGSSSGYWMETFSVPVAQHETIAFKEYIRGLSACPMSRIEPTDESGYWGAARDRIPATANQRFDATPYARLAEPATLPDTMGRRIRVVAPRNMAVIRSGVSWRDCGDEQLASYNKNIKPKLDAGMEYLRTHPVDTGCASLRQVECVTLQGESLPEAYSLGYFLSLKHLEDWSREHPTHLAIFHRAQAERKKYKERLELRTYHEVYILGEDSCFEYVNCHARTGLLPWYTAASTE